MLRSTTQQLQFLRVTPLLLLHPKKTSRRPIRTQHSHRWWKKAKPSHLTARTLEETPDAPFAAAHFNEEVDRPHHHPADTACFQCKKRVDLDVEDCQTHLWIPSGNAKKPYFFHQSCFRCADCGFRFYNNHFYSRSSSGGDGAVCISCALGRAPRFPTRYWHGNSNAVSNGRGTTRAVGHAWPRHQHQVDFLYDPDS